MGILSVIFYLLLICVVLLELLWLYSLFKFLSQPGNVFVQVCLWIIALTGFGFEICARAVFFLLSAALGCPLKIKYTVITALRTLSFEGDDCLDRSCNPAQTVKLDRWR